jgi:hypothetical protein
MIKDLEDNYERRLRELSASKDQEREALRLEMERRIKDLEEQLR